MKRIDSKFWKYLAFTLISTFLLYQLLLLRYLYLPALLPFQPRKFLLALALSLFALFCHIRRSRGSHDGLSGSSYAAQVLIGAPHSADRIVYLDWLRVIAVFFVILIHILGPVYAEMEPHSARWVSLALPGVFLHACNLLFMMISGALLLNGRDEPIHTFYLRRFVRVLIPAFFYFLVYRLAPVGISALYPSNWYSIFADFWTGTDSIPPHYWLIYVILAFYLIAPFFKIMFRHMSDATLVSMMKVIFVLHILYTWLPIFRLPLPFFSFLFSFESLFIFGYFLSRPVADKYYKPIILGGIISILISGIVLRTRYDYQTLLYNNAPTMMLISGAIFMFVKKHTSDPIRPLPVPFRVVSRYSFSILLVHWYILHDVVEQALGIHAYSHGLLLGFPATFVMTLLLCTIFAVVYDNTVIICAETVFDFLSSAFQTFLSRTKNHFPPV